MRERIHGICENCIDGKNCPGLCDAKIAEVKSTYFKTVKEIAGENLELEVAELTEKDIKRIKRHSRTPVRRKGLCKTCDHPTSCETDDGTAYQFCQDRVDEELRGPKDGRCETCIIRVNCSQLCQERIDEFLPEAKQYNDRIDELIQEEDKLVRLEGIRAPKHSKLIKQLTKEAQKKPWFRDWQKYVYEGYSSSYLQVQTETF